MKKNLKTILTGVILMLAIAFMSKSNAFAFEQGKYPLNHDWDGNDYSDSEEHLMELEQKCLDNGYASFCEATSYNPEWTAKLKEYNDYFLVWLTADGYSRNLYLEIDRVQDFVNSASDKEKEENFQKVIDTRIIINYEVGEFRKASEMGKIFLVADLSQLENNYDGLSISVKLGAKDPVILNSENHYEATYDVEVLETSYSLRDENITATDNNGNIYNVTYTEPEVYVEVGQTTTVELAVTLNKSASMASGAQTEEKTEVTPTTAADTDVPVQTDTPQKSMVPMIVGCAIAAVVLIAVIIVVSKKKKSDDD